MSRWIVDDKLTLIDSVGIGGIGQATASASSRDRVFGVLIVTWAMFDEGMSVRSANFVQPRRIFGRLSVLAGLETFGNLGCF